MTIQNSAVASLVVRSHRDRCTYLLCRCVVLSVVLALAFQTSLAQSPIADWANVRNLAPDAPISVNTRGGEKYHGEFLSATEDSLTLASDERGAVGRSIRSRELKRDEIREVRMVAPLASVLAGGAIGAGVGAGIGAGIDASAKSNEDRGLATVSLALLGFAIGLGVALHHPFVKRKRIYVAP